MEGHRLQEGLSLHPTFRRGRTSGLLKPLRHTSPPEAAAAQSYRQGHPSVRIVCPYQSRAQPEGAGAQNTRSSATDWVGTAALENQLNRPLWALVYPSPTPDPRAQFAQVKPSEMGLGKLGGQPWGACSGQGQTECSASCPGQAAGGTVPAEQHLGVLFGFFFLLL